MTVTPFLAQKIAEMADFAAFLHQLRKPTTGKSSGAGGLNSSIKSTSGRTPETPEWTELDGGNVTVPAYQDGPYPRREAETLPRETQSG